MIIGPSLSILMWECARVCVCVRLSQRNVVGNLFRPDIVSHTLFVTSYGSNFVYCGKCLYYNICVHNIKKI